MAEHLDFGEQKLSSPTVTLTSMTFSDGTFIELEAGDVVVLVGPNNAGKSLALREIDEHIGRRHAGKVVTFCPTQADGTKEEFGAFLEKHTRAWTERARWRYHGLGLSLRSGDRAEDHWPENVVSFWPLFCRRMSTETRIVDSNPAEAINLREQSLSHPIHAMFDNDELESRISRYFHQAFGEDLILDRTAGNEWPLLVGERPERLSGEDRLSRSYLDRLDSNSVPLKQQGDGMRSFASVVLHLLTPTTLTVLLLDEPEAFLHPPQARLLGRLIAKERRSTAQLFLATHSPDVLLGLIDTTPENLRILRMQRNGNINQVKELDKELLAALNRDPLMKYSSVLSGLFHSRVIICESEADCMFYGSILDLQKVHGETQPDVLFVHGNGKDRMAKLAGALVPLGVEVNFIVDLDVLNDIRLLKDMVEILGGDWTKLGPLAESLRKDIESSKPGLTYEETVKNIQAEMGKPPNEIDAKRDLRRRINSVFRESSPWDVVKKAGTGALPTGQAARAFQKLDRLCAELGLWIVPEGELEGFCRYVDGHGPRWVQQVLEQKDISSDIELRKARDFMRSVWKRERAPKL